MIVVVVKFLLRFYAATRPPGAPRGHGSPSQALWVGEDRAWPPCPRSGRSRSTHCCAQSAMGPMAACEKGVDQDRRMIHDSPHQRVRSRQRGLESIRVLRNVSCVAREGTCPTGTESSSRRFGGGLQNAILTFQGLRQLASRGGGQSNNVDTPGGGGLTPLAKSATL